MSVERPLYTGDIYRVIGYPVEGMTCGGWAYRAEDPDHPGQWCWWLEMADGDAYPWPDDQVMPDMFAESLELVRRNPLPPEDQAQEVKDALHTS